MKDNTIMKLMVKMLAVLVIGLLLTMEFTGMNLKEIKQHGGAFKAIQYTMEQKSEEVMNNFVDQLMSGM